MVFKVGDNIVLKNRVRGIGGYTQKRGDVATVKEVRGEWIDVVFDNEKFDLETGLFGWTLLAEDFELIDNNK